METRIQFYCYIYTKTKPCVVFQSIFCDFILFYWQDKKIADLHVIGLINFIVINLSDFHSMFHLQPLSKFQNKIYWSPD